jgi:hypothetical protein
MNGCYWSGTGIPTEGLNNSKLAVIPAKAGIHLDLKKQKWIPAFAGMTACLEVPKWRDQAQQTTIPTKPSFA